MATIMEARDYKAGMRFRVIKAGGRLQGLVPWEGQSNAWGGWTRVLHVGDVITCTGSRMGWGSDSVYSVQWEDPEGKACYVDFHPMKGGMWGGLPPADGYLERVEEEADGQVSAG